MKKYPKIAMDCGFVIRSHTMLKICKMARLTFFLVIMGVVQVFALETYSQVTKLTLKFENLELEKVLDAIEEETEFYFLYNRDLIDVKQKVEVDFEDKTITEILDDLLEGKNIRYFHFDRQIVLSNQYGETGITTPAVSLQQGSVSGNVTSPGGQPLPGVTVVIKGTAQGAVTDMNGQYTLTNLPENATLVFSFVGMQTKEVVVTN